jgi:hypothetical protein
MSADQKGPIERAFIQEQRELMGPMPTLRDPLTGIIYPIYTPKLTRLLMSWKCGWSASRNNANLS